MDGPNQIVGFGIRYFGVPNPGDLGASSAVPIVALDSGIVETFTPAKGTLAAEEPIELLEVHSGFPAFAVDVDFYLRLRQRGSGVYWLKNRRETGFQGTKPQ
jgi:hypothetical protein